MKTFIALLLAGSLTTLVVGIYDQNSFTIVMSIVGIVLGINNLIMINRL